MTIEFILRCDLVNGNDRFYRLSKQLIDVSAKYYIASLKLAMAAGSEKLKN